MYKNTVISPLTPCIDNCIVYFNNYLGNKTVHNIKDNRTIQNLITLLLKGIEIILIKAQLDINNIRVLWLTLDGLLHINTTKTKSNNNIHVSKLNAEIDDDDNTCVILYTSSQKIWLKIRFETIDAAELFTSYFNRCVIELNHYIVHHDILSRQLSNTQWKYIENL